MTNTDDRGMDGAGVVIVGGGHAAGQAAVSLRRGGFDRPITIIGEEKLPPYQRPPLSKAYLAGELPDERLLFRPRSFYQENDVSLKLGVRAVAVDRSARMIQLSAGDPVPYAKLIFATGARVRRLSCPGADDPRVLYLRGADDADRLRPHLNPGAPLAIIGAGYIGLEVAAVARRLGADVTVIEAAPRVMGRVTGPEVAAFMEDEHRKAGVAFRFGVALERIEPSAEQLTLVMADGSRLSASACVVGIGVAPNQEVAQDAGLRCEDGIVVDQHTQTDDPDILAIGDCTRHPNAGIGRSIRLESVHNALEQAKTAAAAICGAPAPYDQAPWFWSDQYDLKLQTVGLMGGHDSRVVRGDPAARSFSVFYLKGEKIVAVDAVNAPADFMAAKVMAAKGIHPAASVLRDVSVPLKSMLQSG